MERCSIASTRTDISRPLAGSNVETRRTLPKLILLFGPTGVGKTSLLDRLFAGLAEIVSADALQIYRKMNIGTAKPDSSLLKRLPHHLIDILEIGSSFSVGDFCRRADQAISDILSRGKLPVISGGTAFYLKAWLLGLPDTPATDPQIRRSVEQRWNDADIDELRSALSGVDPESAERIGTNDRYRLMRAMEVFQQTGRPLSSFTVPETPRSDYSVLSIGLSRERTELYRRINARVEQMFQGGLEEEIRTLREAGAKPEDPGMKAIGYREWFEFSGASGPGDGLCDEVREQIKSRVARNSRRYAKRQITFFSSLPAVHWFDASENPYRPGGLIETIEKFLGYKICYQSLDQ